MGEMPPAQELSKVKAIVVAALCQQSVTATASGTGCAGRLDLMMGNLRPDTANCAIS
jgi:hypothetical protein